MTEPEPPHLPTTRLTRAWLPLLRREASRLRRLRRLRQALIAFAALDLLVVAAVVVLLSWIGSSSPTTAAARLPAFVTGRDRRRLATAFDRAARESHVSAALLMGVSWRESEWRQRLVSAAGAVGIGQLLPPTATFVARELLHDPRLDPGRSADNIRITARYLRSLFDALGGDERLAIGAYLQGAPSVQAQGLAPATVAYVDQVETLRHAFARARRGH